MGLIESIGRYRQSGDPAVLANIRLGMSLDAIAARRRAGIDGGADALISLRCIRLLAGPLSAVAETLAIHGIDPVEDDPARIFAEYAAPIRERLDLELSPDNFERHADELRGYLGNAYPPLFKAYQRLIGIRPTVWQLLSARIVDEHWPRLEAALRTALAAVDLSAARSERQAARMVNRALRRLYRRDPRRELPLAERGSGMPLRTTGTPSAIARARLAGQRPLSPGADGLAASAGRGRLAARHAVAEPAYYGASYAIFGQGAVSSERFSRGQQRLVARIRTIVEEDAAQRRFDDYEIDEQGGYRIAPRYIAKRLRMEPERLASALSGIRRAVRPAAEAER